MNVKVLLTTAAIAVAVVAIVYRVPSVRKIVLGA